LKKINIRAEAAWFVPILGLCALLGCSKPKAPLPVVAVRLVTVTTNASGEVLVQLSLTNHSASAILVGVRCAIHQAQGSRTTNFDIRPRFVGLAGPGSEASDVTLAAGSGITAALSPFHVPSPFRLEFVCFPSRLGIEGIVDKAKDKINEFRDGSPRESYLGGSFFVLSPLIDTIIELNAPPTRDHARLAGLQPAGFGGDTFIRTEGTYWPEPTASLRIWADPSGLLKCTVEFVHFEADATHRQTDKLTDKHSLDIYRRDKFLAYWDQTNQTFWIATAKQVISSQRMGTTNYTSACYDYTGKALERTPAAFRSEADRVFRSP